MWRGQVGARASSFPALSHPQGAPTINLARSKVKNSPLYLEAGTSRGLLGPQGEMAPLDDRAGELQLGGGLPTDHFFHGVSADQPNNLHRPAPKRKRGACDRGRQTWAHAWGQMNPRCRVWAPLRGPVDHARVLTEPSRSQGRDDEVATTRSLICGRGKSLLDLGFPEVKAKAFFFD